MDFGLTESELMHRAASGDGRAQAKILENYRGRLKQMIAARFDKRLSARMDPSDIVQEAMKDAYRRMREYFAGPQLSFYLWLRRIAADRLTDTYRQHVAAAKRSVLRENAWQPNLNDESVSDLAHSIVTSSLGPSDRVLRDENQDRAIQAIMQLKEQDREILAMRYLEQMSVAEIAEMFGISQTAVTSRHLRALQRLRRAINERGDQPR